MKTRTYTAAGGVVLDDEGCVLLITRDVDRTDGAPSHEVRLPKGHVEAGETDEQAAQREVCEETGYCEVRIVADLGTTQTDFMTRGESVSRTEHYYLMQLTHRERSEPHFDDSNAEEARFQPLWVPNLEEAARQLTFASERQFAARAQAWVAREQTDAGLSEPTDRE